MDFLFPRDENVGPFATPRAGIPEMALRALPALFPSNVPVGIGGRLVQGASGVLGESMREQRTDPQNIFRAGLQKLPFEAAPPTIQPLPAGVQGPPTPFGPPAPPGTLLESITRTPLAERQAKFGLVPSLGAGAVFKPEQFLNVARGASIIGVDPVTGQQRTVAKGAPKLQGTVGSVRPRNFKGPGGVDMVQQEELVAHDATGKGIYKPFGTPTRKHKAPDQSILDYRAAATKAARARAKLMETSKLEDLASAYAKVANEAFTSDSSLTLLLGLDPTKTDEDKAAIRMENSIMWQGVLAIAQRRLEEERLKNVPPGAQGATAQERLRSQHLGSTPPPHRPGRSARGGSFR